MKNFIFVLMSAMLIFSCSNDDDANTPELDETLNYLPIANQNEWKYSYSESDTGDTDIIQTIMGGTYTSNGISFNSIEDTFPIFGLETTSAGIRKEGNSYYMNGEVDLEFEGADPIVVENEKFLDENASIGTIINTLEFIESGEGFPINQVGMELTVTPIATYRVPITLTNRTATETFNGVTYNDVLQLTWTYILSMELQMNGTYSGIPVSYTHKLFMEENTGSLQSYYANNIGVVHSVLNIDYSDIEHDTMITPPGIQPIDISSYLEEFISDFEELEFTGTFVLESTNVGE